MEHVKLLALLFKRTTPFEAAQVWDTGRAAVSVIKCNCAAYLEKHQQWAGALMERDTYRWDGQLQPQGEPADYQSHHAKQAHPGEGRESGRWGVQMTLIRSAG